MGLGDGDGLGLSRHSISMEAFTVLESSPLQLPAPAGAATHVPGAQSELEHHCSSGVPVGEQSAMAEVGVEKLRCGEGLVQTLFCQAGWPWDQCHPLAWSSLGGLGAS